MKLIADVTLLHATDTINCRVDFWSAARAFIMANQSMPQLESLINDKYRNERLAQELENAFLRSGKKLRDDCDPYHNKE